MQDSTVPPPGSGGSSAPTHTSSSGSAASEPLGSLPLARDRPRSSSSSSSSSSSDHHFAPLQTSSFMTTNTNYNTNAEGFRFESQTMVNLTLRTCRFVSVCAVAIVALAVFLGVSCRRLTLEDQVTQSQVSDTVSKYNSIQGPLMFAMSKISEFYLDVLVLPVFITYLNNTPWFPGDDPRREEYKFKKIAMFWAMQLLLIVMNIGWASLYIGQAVSKVQHVFTAQDLMVPPIPTPLVPSNVLRHSIVGKSTPFQIIENPQCAMPDNQYGALDATTVAYGFQRNDWHAYVQVQKPETNGNSSGGAATKTKANTVLRVRFGDFVANAKPFNDQAQAMQLPYVTHFELFLQGKTLLEQSLSELDLTKRYDCTEVNPKSTTKDCFGARSSLQLLANYSDPQFHQLTNLLDSIATGLEFSELISSDGKSDLQLTFQTTQLTSQLTLDSMVLQVPVTGKDYAIDGSNTTARVDCGTKRCMYGVKTIFRKEVAMLPYQKHCQTGDMSYDDTVGQFLPTNCQADDTSAFVYGLGSHVDGKFGSGDRVDSLQHFVTLSFSKLTWETSNINKMFGVDTSKLTDPQVLALEISKNTTGPSDFVLASRQALPREYLSSDLRMPYRLVTLSPVVQYMSTDNSFYTYERVRSTPVTSPPCKGAAESYLNHIESNFLYLEEPLEVSYMAALYYLFQHGVEYTGGNHVKGKDTVGGTFGSLAIKFGTTVTQVQFSVPASSAITTFAACGGMVLLMFFVVFLPTSRVKLNPNTTAAADYVDILTDDSYPSQVHDKKLVTSTGEQLEMEEFVAESIVLHAKEDENKRIFL